MKVKKEDGQEVRTAVAKLYAQKEALRVFGGDELARSKLPGMKTRTRTDKQELDPAKLEAVKSK